MIRFTVGFRSGGKPAEPLMKRALLFLFFIVSLFVFADEAPQTQEPDPLASGSMQFPVSGLEFDHVETTDIHLEDSDFLPVPEWNGEIPETALLFKNIIEKHAEALKIELGEKEYFKEVARDKVLDKATFPDFGRAEVNSIDHHEFVRVVSYRDHFSYVFVDIDKIPVESKSFRRYIARQHIDAGKKDERGWKPGRDVVLVKMKNGKIESTEYLPRHPPFSESWWGDYLLASISGKVTKNDVIFATLCTLPQVAIATCVSSVKYFVTDPGSDFDWVNPAASTIYSMAISTFNSFYRNIVYRGTESSKLAKLTGLSLLYNYSFAIATGGVMHIFRVWPGNWTLHVHLLANAVLHNLGRKAWYKIPENNTKSRRNAENNVKVKLLGKTIEVNRATVEQQAIYLMGPYTLKTIGLVGLGVAVSLPIIGQVDWGTLMLLGSVPVVNWYARYHAKKHNIPWYDEVAMDREELERRKIGLPRAILRSALSFGRMLLKPIKKTCSMVLIKGSSLKGPFQGRSAKEPTINWK